MIIFMLSVIALILGLGIIIMLDLHHRLTQILNEIKSRS